MCQRVCDLGVVTWLLHGLVVPVSRRNEKGENKCVRMCVFVCVWV